MIAVSRERASLAGCSLMSSTQPSLVNQDDGNDCEGGGLTSNDYRGDKV
jgi:hypothetical protein